MDNAAKGQPEKARKSKGKKVPPRLQASRLITARKALLSEIQRLGRGSVAERAKVPARKKELDELTRQIKTLQRRSGNREIDPYDLYRGRKSGRGAGRETAGGIRTVVSGGAPGLGKRH